MSSPKHSHTLDPVGSSHDVFCSKTTTDTMTSTSSKRPTTLIETGLLNASVRFEDVESEGRPSIYLFIFVNPLSGDCKGEDLVKLPIQHFRLRRFPQVQVEIHNILDPRDRDLGLANIRLVEEMAKLGKLPSLNKHNESEAEHKIGEAVRTRHIHVWSAGGDGTVMSVFEMLVSHMIDLDMIFFSCNFNMYKQVYLDNNNQFLFRYSLWHRQ